MSYGYIPSVLDGSEVIYDNVNKNMSLNLPDEYSYQKFLPSVLDQGVRPICVPCSISSNIEWKHSINGEKFKTSLDWIFDCRENKKLEGMTMKEALSFIKNYGYVSNNEYRKNNYDELLKISNKIKSYARLINPLFMKYSLLTNGPFIISLYVKDIDRTDFWNGNGLIGGHAIACVGYNKDGFIIRNSWGSSYGDGGYAILPYNDFGKIIEAWAII